ncbi:MAG: signal peptidase I [Arsenophonus sp.]
MANTFSLILTIATFITGIIWVINYFKLRSDRNKKKDIHQKIDVYAIEKTHLLKSVYKSSWLNACSSVFPILTIVLVIRSFVYEPFRIPSGSMMPTLLAGDFILVEKFSYGLKDPLTQRVLLKTGKPKRGDIAVFKYPKDPSIDFVKRIIGLPGDKIIYDPEQKELHIYPNCSISNCLQKLQTIYSSPKDSEWVLFFNINSIIESQKGSHKIPLNKPVSSNGLRQVEKTEKLDGIIHNILLIPQSYTRSLYHQTDLEDNTWKVPPKHYFMMGDNRDNSSDSRMWGLVPEKNLVGRAVSIWFSVDKDEGEWPTGIRLNRIGTVN